MFPLTTRATFGPIELQPWLTAAPVGSAVLPLQCYLDQALAWLSEYIGLKAC